MTLADEQQKDTPLKYTTSGGINIERFKKNAPYETAIKTAANSVNNHRGAVFSSNYEYPGRYTRWDTAVVNPPIVITSRGYEMSIRALNERGAIILPWIASALKKADHIEITAQNQTTLDLKILQSTTLSTEEDRPRTPSVFTALRAITSLFHTEIECSLGLYGAFGYDLCFQFDPIEFHLKRPNDQRDLVLFLPDEVLIVDHYLARAWYECFDFEHEGISTKGFPRETPPSPFIQKTNDKGRGDHAVGEYAELVKKAMPEFKNGNLFEVVPGQTFYETCASQPSEISHKLKEINPSPYSFFINLGDNEYLIGASPEMFVRVNGRRIETCPISGTIKRGNDAISDSEQILKLLNSKKDESELTMCSDVDRNDKSRVCVPGSVRVIGRRQIEMYSRLIHTVDHIEGRLREDMDAFDAFLSHAWAVTVTGAPKLWAMRFIEKNEKSPRGWYGGAVGMVNFNGDMNTGLTLRTIRLKDGIAEVRAGATLLFDSNPEEEEAETELKASALIAAVREAASNAHSPQVHEIAQVGLGVKMILIDHEDSFVHTLANYFRRTGAEVTTIRPPVSDAVFDTINPDFVVLSPGPGTPSDFNCTQTIEQCLKRNLPIFGVCLGLQALVEAFGGTLSQLDIPVHGKPSRINILDQGIIFSGLPSQVTVGRYHSLYANPNNLPADFTVTAKTDDGVIMAIEHNTKPILAVQFHPESIMTLGEGAGMRMIENVVKHLPKHRKSSS